MTDIEKAKQLFSSAGLAFPTIPEELAARLREQGNRRLAMRDNIGDVYAPSWLFSTREIDMSPYNLQHYVHEVEGGPVEDYAILSHTGHGVNSYAIQYYLVWGSLCMFLHLGWGGAYSNAEEDAAMIRNCFSTGDRIVSAPQLAGGFKTGERLTVVGSDFYGSYCLLPGQSRQSKAEDHESPSEVLTQVLDWLTNKKRVAKGLTRSKKKC